MIRSFFTALTVLATITSATASNLPDIPSVVTLDEETGRSLGKRGGTITMLMARQKDLRVMSMYSYARLIKYNRNLELVPDIAHKVDIVDDRIFTFHLRPNHRWSDGSPFTAEDFRYMWEEVLTHPVLERGGLSQQFLADGKPPKFEMLDPLTIRYTWASPNPKFIPAIAGARPLELFINSKYMQQFHADFANAEELAKEVEEEGVKDWKSLHIRKSRSYRPENPDLPTLQPWRNTTPPPGTRFTFKRNPYFHKTDQNGIQLPYIDGVVINIAESSIIPAKTGSGEVDLQERYLRFDDYTFLKAGETNNDYQVRLWKVGRGSVMTIYPNLNTNDEIWRDTMRDVRFRRALSLAINRHEINQILFFGLANESANTVLPESPLYKRDYQNAYANFDLDKANQLLDEMELKVNPKTGIRMLSDGRPIEIIVESAGESTLEADTLDLVRDTWAKVGIKLFTRASQRDVFQSRVASGSTLMSISQGVDNGMPTASIEPKEFTPTDPYQLQWPKWGQHRATSGEKGEEVSDQNAKRLNTLYDMWLSAKTHVEKTAIWDEILQIHSDQIYGIGILNSTLSPVVVANRLKNVPKTGVLAFAPLAYFGAYEMDTFWLTDAGEDK